MAREGSAHAYVGGGGGVDGRGSCCPAPAVRILTQSPRVQLLQAVGVLHNQYQNRINSTNVIR
jgi:hypothetical protein